MILTYPTIHIATRTMKLLILFSVVTVLAFAKQMEVSDRGSCRDNNKDNACKLLWYSIRNCRRPDTYNECKKVVEL